MRKRGIGGIATLVVLALLVGCGGGGSKSDKKASLQGATGASTSAACKATPKKGGSLVYERQAETATLDPLNVINGNGDIFTYNIIYGGLVRSDPNGSPRLGPGLAGQGAPAAGGKTYTFTLRPGIKFSNGQPVTAQDVAWSLNRFGNPKINAAMSSVSVGYDHASVVNPSTVRVKLKQPVAAFLYNISIWPADILPKNLVEKQGKAFFKHPVGTGPFVVKDFVKGSHITFVRNPHYWEKGKPYLDQVRYNFATDSNSRILAVRGGSAQIMDGVPFSQIDSLRKSKKLQIQAAKVPLFLGLWLNHKSTGFADLNVRKAMQMAINRAQIKQQILHGLGDVPNSVLMGLKYDAPASQVKPYPYDVGQAKKLMAQSKFPKGFSTTLQYPSGYDYYNQLALLLQQEFSQIGIKVKLVQEDPGAATSKFLAMKYDMAFPFPSFTSDVIVPDEYADFLADPSNGLNGFFSNWSDPAIQKMVQQFQSADESARAQSWAKIQQALYEQTPVINV